MRKRWGWILAGVILAGMAIAALWSGRTSLASVHFPDGRTSRILKVSYGTNHVFSGEPVWKKSLRKILPQMLEKHLGAARVSRSITDHDSLAIYLEPLGSKASAMKAEAVFPDGTTFGTFWKASLQDPIVFENYPRGEKLLVVRLWDGWKPVEIQVPNPRPVARASWTPRAFPQTNYVPGTEVILKECGSLVSLRCIIPRSTVGGEVGWMQWRTLLLDPWGNWKPNRYHQDFQFRYHQDQFPGAKSERVFKFLAKGKEYLSAAFVELPARERYQVLPVNARISNWGVRLLVLFGPGRYEVSKDLSVKTGKSGPVRTNSVELIGSSWMIQCAEPAALSISERPVQQMRLRERLPHDGGRIFWARTQRRAKQRGMEAQLFTPRLPTVTTNLEVEVIVDWPPVEFFVERPE